MQNNKRLFIFEFANNHNGSLDKALEMVDSAKRIADSKYLDFAIKLQYRDLKTFIHKASKNNNKHIKRFKEAKLSNLEYSKICHYIKKKGFKLVITPFDEISVDRAIQDNVDILKIASCSNNDWPLIEKIASKQKTVICSTGGLDLDQIDSLYNFFIKRVKFVLMHCVSIYPITDLNDFNLNFISKMNRRYPDCEIGYSGHEEDNNFLPVLLSSALNCKYFERHFSIMSDKNKYSIGEDNLEELIKLLNNSLKILGKAEKVNSLEENNTLDLLRRGVFAKVNVRKNDKLNSKNTYFAFPKFSKKQATPFSKLSNPAVINLVKKDNPILQNNLIDKSNLHYMRKIIHRYKFLLIESGISFPENSSVELSHHYGFDKIEKIGVLLLTVINNSMYCKKIIALLPGQFHPQHKHFKKVETFHVLYGKLFLKKENKNFTLVKGDTIDIYNGEWHSFWAKDEGAIFEEISTESLKTDSEYFDAKINKADRLLRKTAVLSW